MKKLAAVVGSIAALALLLIAGGVGKLAGRAAVDGYSASKTETALVDAASNLNKTLPKMVDVDTRLDKTSGGPGMRFSYQHTLINYPGPSQNPFDVFDNLENFTAELSNKVCTNPQMSPMFKNGVTLVYEYLDKHGKKLFEVVIPPSRCSA